MADNTADFTKKILVDVEVNAEQVKRDIPVLTKSIQDLNDAQKILEAQGKKNSLEFVENASQLRLLKAEVREANKYIDNTSKAINAQTNSIQQNRALLSLMTAEHIKLGQANGNTKAQVEASAKAINNLTDVLKAQEKAIGQTYRNVGNYSDAIKEAAGQIGNFIPGFQQFASVANTVTKIGGFLPSALAKTGSAFASTSAQISNFVGFKQYSVQADQAKASNDNLSKSVDGAAGAIGKIKEATGQASQGIGDLKTEETGLVEETTAVAESAEGVTEGFSLMAAGGVALTGVLGAIVLGVAAVVSYFKDLDTFTDGATQNISGLKAGFSELGRIMARGSVKGGENKMFDGLDKLKSIKAAYDQTKELVDQQQQLEDTQLNNTVESGKRLAQVYKLQVEAKNKTLDPGESQKLLDKATAIDAEDLKIKQTMVNREIDLAKQAIYITGHLTDFQKQQLDKRGVDYALYLQNNLVKQGKVTDEQTKNLASALNKQTQIQQEFTQRDEKRQNLADSRDEKDEAKKERADAKAKAEADKAERLRAAQAAALSESENIRKSSANRILQDIYEEYGDRVVAADTAFNNELLKLKKFLDKKLITQAEYNSVEAQLIREHNSKLTTITTDFQKQDFEKYQAAANQLRQLQISNIEETGKRQIADIKERGIEQAQELDKQNIEHQKNIDALNKEIAGMDGKEKTEAEERRLHELALIEVNEGKRIQIAKQTESQIAAINKKALDDQNKLKDSNDVNAADTKFGSNSSEALEARQKQLLDNYNAEVTQEGLTAAAKLEIERKYLADKDALDKGARLATAEFAINAEQQIQSAVFDLISQNQQQASEKKINDMEQSKNAELQNTSLTNTEKQLINNKYQKLEDKEKLKAFKANQKLQVANVLINSAVAVLKNSAELGFLPAIPINALTVALAGLSISKILSAKPGFATGGVYESDGKGAALSGYSKHDNMNARLRSGEGIVVSEAMRDPYARNTISAINQAYGGRSFSVPGPKSPFMPGFAGGGVFTDGGNANRYYNQPVINSSDLANTLAYQLINNFPPVLVDVKDIIAQQGILVTTQNRVIL